MSRLSAHDVQAVLAGVDLVGLVRGYAELRKAGRQWQGACPFCLGGTDRFVVLPEKGRCFCRRCDFHGDGIEFVQRLENLGWRQAVERLAGGTLPSADEVRRRVVKRAEQDAKSEAWRRRSAEEARRAWAAARAVAGTPAEAYLRGRGITVALPPTLRFAERFRHWDPKTKTETHWPALVAGIRLPDSGLVTAIQATCLGWRGGAAGWSKAPVDKPRKVFGTKRFGTIRLTPAGLRLNACEGVETGLSVLQALGGPAKTAGLDAVWSAIDTDSLANLVLPAGASEVVVWADRDAVDNLPRHAPDGMGPGERAARRLLDRAAAAGVGAGLKLPPAKYADGDGACDWNDVLVKRARAGVAA